MTTAMSEVVQAFREDFLDDADSEYLWPNKAVMRYINDAIYQANALTMLFTKTATITLAPGQPDYPLPCDARSIDKIAFDGECPLLMATRQELTDRGSCCWINVNGKPSRYTRKDATLTFYPKPIETGTVTVDMWVNPPKFTLDGDLCLSPINIHNLLYWASYRAFLKPDADCFDKNRAMDMRALFEGFFGKPKSELMQKMMRELPMGAGLRVGRIA